MSLSYVGDEELDVGDCIVFKVRDLLFKNLSSIDYCGVVLGKNYLYSSDTRWGERKFFNYSLYCEGKIINYSNSELVVIDVLSV
jgi:hypothetical protein